jgi:signal transduction histidine kinase/ActR/RegA family two-component response regulator
VTAGAFLELTAVLPEACLLVRGDGEVQAANAAAGRLVGRPSQELVGLSLFALAADEPRLRRFLQDASGTRTMIPGRLGLRRRDGSDLDCRAECAAIRPGGPDGLPLLLLRCTERGSSDRFLLLNQKIDELSTEVRLRMKLEEERERLLASEQAARQSAERANRMKDEFLATLSHELRTPLNAIIGWVSMLRSGVAGDQLEKGLETIHRAAHAQTQLIDDLLDVSRIITGKLRIELRPINPSEAVRAAVDSVEPAATAKGVRLEKMIAPDAGPVSGDPDRIQQIVWNLLSNALKFTRRGGRVQVRVEPVNSHVEIIVSDTGDGIDPALLPFIFDRFRQGESSLTRSHQGLGLGLSIVRHLVEAHGGQVHVFSEGADMGTTFTVMLPLLVYQRSAVLSGSSGYRPAQRPEDFQQLGSDRLANVRVLIVEDEPDSRDMLVDLFTSVGAHAVGVRTTAEALEQLEAFRPDVMVSDIELIGEDGYMLVRKVRALPPSEGGRTPAVALTAFSQSADRVRALASGFQMHVPKPAEPLELIAVVASLVGKGGVRWDIPHGGSTS